jgi:hypothetical protein
LRDTFALASEHPVEVPGDESPAIEMDDVVEGVIVELRKRGR